MLSHVLLGARRRMEERHRTQFQIAIDTNNTSRRELVVSVGQPLNLEKPLPVFIHATGMSFEQVQHDFENTVCVANVSLVTYEVKSITKGKVVIELVQTKRGQLRLTVQLPKDSRWHYVGGKPASAVAASDVITAARQRGMLTEPDAVMLFNDRGWLAPNTWQKVAESKGWVPREEFEANYVLRATPEEIAKAARSVRVRSKKRPAPKAAAPKKNAKRKKAAKRKKSVTPRRRKAMKAQRKVRK